ASFLTYPPPPPPTPTLSPYTTLFRSFWFTDLGKTRARDADRGAVYYANADGSSIREAIFPLERPNGIGLSPDGRTLYVVETPTRSEEHTSELQSRFDIVCRLLLEKKN